MAKISLEGICEIKWHITNSELSFAKTALLQNDHIRSNSIVELICNQLIKLVFEVYYVGSSAQWAGFSSYICISQDTRYMYFGDTFADT